MSELLSQPLVTVYIPTHNRAELVCRAVESVQKQSYRNIEIIVVDDGSTDSTYEALSGYIAASEIVYLKNDVPKGAPYARNRAIQNAKGKFITGLDDDDFFLSGRIESLLENYDDKYSFISSGYKVIYEDFERPEHNGDRVVTLDDILRANVVGNQVLVKVECLRQLGGFDNDLPAWQDYDMWIRLIRRYGSGFRVGKALYVVDKSHPHERISGNTDKVDKAYELFLSKHLEFKERKYFSYLKVSHMHYHLDKASLKEVLTTFAGGAYKRSLGLIARKYGVKA